MCRLGIVTVLGLFKPAMCQCKHRFSTLYLVQSMVLKSDGWHLWGGGELSANAWGLEEGVQMEIAFKAASWRCCGCPISRACCSSDG